MSRKSGPKPWFFDLWSRFYDVPLVQRLSYRPVQDAVMRELRRSASRRVLDVGCGTGLLTTRIGAELAPKPLVGCDFSHGMLEVAAHRSDAIPWVRGDASGCLSPTAASTPWSRRRPSTGSPSSAPRWPSSSGCSCPRAGSSSRSSTHAPWIARAAMLSSQLAGEPARWPTRQGLRLRMEDVGFRVDGQTTVLRLPTPLLLPCVLTQATRPG